MRLFATAIPKKITKLYFLSVPLFLLHVAEEYFTLYYPLLFGVTYRYDLPKERFITVETIVIIMLFVFAFLLYKKLLPTFALILPGMLYVWQLEHIYYVVNLHIYYQGIFTGLFLVILGGFYWKDIIVFFLKGK